MYENNLSQELAQQEVNYSLQQQDESIENHTYVGEEVLFFKLWIFSFLSPKVSFCFRKP